MKRFLCSASNTTRTVVVAARTKGQALAKASVAFASVYGVYAANIELRQAPEHARRLASIVQDAIRAAATRRYQGRKRSSQKTPKQTAVSDVLYLYHVYDPANAGPHKDIAVEAASSVDAIRRASSILSILRADEDVYLLSLRLVTEPLPQKTPYQLPYPSFSDAAFLQFRRLVIDACSVVEKPSKLCV